MKRTLNLLLTTMLLNLAAAPLVAQSDVYNSGGPLMAEQAAYDVGFYALTLSVNPGDSTIDGTLRVDARVVAPVTWLVLDLDPVLAVRSVKPVTLTDGAAGLSFERRGGKLWIQLPHAAQPGDKLSVTIEYGGRPMAAPVRKGSWSDGFLWTRSKTGEPWLGVVSVLNGADIWWPCKDHPSDEPDSMAINITVPEPLTVASNGRLRDYRRFRIDGKRMHSFHWFVSTPINNYGVTLNIAQYSKLEDSYRSINGETFPITFWVMPDDYFKAMTLFPQISEHMNFLERTLGPYPFRADKYAVAQTPYSGMEHQTIISYGGDFKDNEYGFDTLHFHELSHEWFANLVTAPDWRDWWLHEGVASYLEAIYAESLHDTPAYHRYMAGFRSRIQNVKPLAPRETQRTRDIYGGDLYSKGAWVLHSLRYLIGKKELLRALRQLAYPEPALEYVTDGRQCHFVTTDEFQRVVESVSGRRLGWFFDVYLRQPRLPQLGTSIAGNTLTLRWSVPDDLPFPMPVAVRLGPEVRQISMAEAEETVEVPDGFVPHVDPDNWILKADLN